MAFCKGGLAAVRNIVHHIDDELEKTIETITTITGKIKDLEANPNVDAVVKMIPGGSLAEGWINSALDKITGVTDSVKPLAEKLVDWVDTFTSELDKNGNLFKLASAAVLVADDKKSPDKTESFYDSAVQLHIMSEKNAS